MFSLLQLVLHCTGRTLQLTVNKWHVSGTFESIGEGGFSSCQSVLDKSNATDVDRSSQYLEAESELSSANLVNSCAAVTSDLKAACVGCSFHGRDCSRYPAAC